MKVQHALKISFSFLSKVKLVLKCPYLRESFIKNVTKKRPLFSDDQISGDRLIEIT